MAEYILSKAADADIERIARYSIKEWGHRKAESYLLGLHRAFENAASFPDAGRSAEDIRKGYRRLESESHVIFYRRQGKDILIIRVLHRHMLSVLHL